MDFQYHICMIKPRLYDLALGGVWLDVPLSWRRSTPLTILAMKKGLVVWFSISIQLCMHVVVSIVMGL